MGWGEWMVNFAQVFAREVVFKLAAAAMGTMLASLAAGKKRAANCFMELS